MSRTILQNPAVNFEHFSRQNRHTTLSFTPTSSSPSSGPSKQFYALSGAANGGDAKTLTIWKVKRCGKKQSIESEDLSGHEAVNTLASSVRAVTWDRQRSDAFFAVNESSVYHVGG